MAMTILNNSAAIMTLGQLNKSITKVGKAITKVSTGQRINSASDEASAYGISEKMRVQIRGLEQDIQNVQNGSAMLKTASSGIEEIVNELRNLKELAINSANDSNSDVDRETIQRDFDQKRAIIDEIAITTNYNSKTLLDGTYSRHKLPEEYGLSEPTGNETIIENDYIVNRDGVFTLGASCKNSTITVNAKNVKIKGSGGTNTNIFIECKNPNTNLWIENLVDEINQDRSAIRFIGSDNTLNLIGSNSVVHNMTYKATINVGDGLTINNGDSEGNGSFTASRTRSFTEGALIGSDANEKTNKGYIIINGGNITVDYNQLGAAIGSGNNGSIGNITINGGTIRAVSGSHAAAIGAGRGECTVGDIIINGGDITAGAYGSGTAAIGGCANNNCVVGDIIFRGGKIAAENSSPTTGIPSVYGNNRTSVIGGGSGRCGTITTPSEGEWNNFANGSYHNYNQDLPDFKDNPKKYVDDPLWIQHGTHANQRINVYINSMRSEVLGIEKADVSTRIGATSAISIIDSAITYSLEEATNVGAYLKRMEYTELNVTTEDENIQAAESTIRDADMAKEMTEYTKFNVLGQASQSMLAQSNQNLSGVLSLLQ